ncbi:hypothetical protein WJX73_001058 [Symbiochloris irregularis]|uniref:DUF4385 domain-containing protein n=1 Tax=Symbiochloris irregularis TaxID=706552 RepID=A0AAW1P2T8_9CHLO
MGKKRKFDYDIDFANTDFRAHPELYQIGRGEQGVLSVQPYKDEILPKWRFKTPEIARESAEAIYNQFQEYSKARDFVGMDMARKFLQMGHTRSRRYANHKTGIKKGKGGETLPRDLDPVKAECAEIFKVKLEVVKQDSSYLSMKADHLLLEAKTTAEMAEAQSGDS